MSISPPLARRRCLADPTSSAAGSTGLVLAAAVLWSTGGVEPPLLIDQRSASLNPDATEIRAWAQGRRAFVSSLITDMPAERRATRQAITDFGATPVMFEDDLGGQDIPADRAYLSGVATSDIYIGLWGPRYGVRMGDGYSATHAEFIAAEQHGLRLCLFVNGQTSTDMDGPQRDLIAGARNLYTTASWTDPTDLAGGITRRLTELAAEDLTPWVRIGRVVLRAASVSADGSTYTVIADVRDPAVNAELLRLRDGNRELLPFASPTEAKAVRVESVNSRTLSNTRHEHTLVLRVGDDRTTSLRVSSNGVTADELARQAISDGLFGTSLLDRDSWIKPEDPLSSLRGRRLDDAVVRPVSRLLLTEHLLRSENASTINEFALGPSHQGNRRLRLTWTPPAQYTNFPDPEPLTIDGTISDL